MGAPFVRRNLGGGAGPRGLQQNVAQPPRIAALEVKSLAEYLMATARVRWAEAVVLDLADIEYSLVPVGQICCHGGISQAVRCFPDIAALLHAKLATSVLKGIRPHNRRDGLVECPYSRRSLIGSRRTEIRRNMVRLHASVDKISFR
jgi:hypothetical protein